MPSLKFAERLQAGVASSLMRSRLVGLTPKLMPKRATNVDGLTLHPELQLMLALREALGTRSWHEQSVARARAQIEAESRTAAGEPVRVGPVRNFQIPGPTGPIRVRHYAAPLSGSRPLVVFYHGGGFVLGSLDSHDQPCRILCAQAGVDVLSVDYRLAPEHPFPAGPEDASAAYRWARENAALLGTDGKLATCGDSAGANLATVVALMAKSAGLPVPHAQFLLYPTVNRAGAWRSMELFAQHYFLTARDIAWCTELYVGSADLRNPLISPLLAPDLSGIGPAFVVTAGFDPLRDEGEAYEKALRQAGNSTHGYRAPDMIHGFINSTGISPACEGTYRDVVSQFKTFLDSVARGAAREQSKAST
jgi:acetyl esterase